MTLHRISDNVLGCIMLVYALRSTASDIHSSYISSFNWMRNTAVHVTVELRPNFLIGTESRQASLSLSHTHPHTHTHIHTHTHTHMRGY